MFSSFISREIGSALAMYEQQQLNYFRYHYLDKLELQFSRLDIARKNFLESAKSNQLYLETKNTFLNSQQDKDATALFYQQRDKILTDLMNDKHNKFANKLWKEMNRSEELVFDIRNSLYGGRAETKYHIGIQVTDGDNRLLKSYELNPKQMLKLQGNKGIFKAEISTSKGIDNFDFSLRFSTQRGLTANNLIKAITSEGGQLYNVANMESDFLTTYSSVYSSLRDLNTMTQIQERMDLVQQDIDQIISQRKGIGYKTDASRQERARINAELKAKRDELNELLKSQNRAINFGYGRAFEAYERQKYGLEYMPTADNNIRYNDNTSWVMQQDINFVDKTNQAKLIMIQNKFFTEGNRFSTISMSSLFSSLESFKEYFSMSETDFEEFYKLAEMDKQTGRRLDEEVFAFLQDEVVGSLQEDSSGNSDSGWFWED